MASLWDRVWKAPGRLRAGGAPPPQRLPPSGLSLGGEDLPHVHTGMAPGVSSMGVWMYEPGLCLPALHMGCTWLRWVGAPAGSLGLERRLTWGRWRLGCSLGARMTGGWEGEHVGGAPSRKKE